MDYILKINVNLRNVDVSLLQKIDDETEDLLAILLLLLLLKIYFYDIISVRVIYFLYHFLSLYYPTQPLLYAVMGC